MSNMTAYTDMSWDELVEKAKELGYEYSNGVLYNIDNSNACEFTFDRWTDSC